MSSTGCVNSPQRQGGGITQPTRPSLTLPRSGVGGGWGEEIVGLGSVVGEPHDDRVRLHRTDAGEADLRVEIKGRNTVIIE